MNPKRIIRFALEKDLSTWVGITLAYTCPSCGKLDRQVMVFHVQEYDLDLIMRTAHSGLTPCNICSERLPKNLVMEVDIRPAALERLREAGYPVPQIN